MKSTKSILLVGLFALTLAAPVQAQDAAEAAAMPCKDYLALDAAAMMEVTTAFMADPMATSMMGDVSVEEATAEIMADCQMMPDATLTDTLQMSM